VKEKIATGRASAAKEKIIKEKIALEKAKIEAVKSKQVIEQADEMAALLARLDARSATMKRR
jgi:colicin import membrane protein